MPIFKPILVDKCMCITASKMVNYKCSIVNFYYSNGPFLRIAGHLVFE